MKTLKLLTLALAIAVGFSSCDKDDETLLTDTVDNSYFVEVDMNGKSMILPEGKDGYRSVAAVGIKPTVSRCIRTGSMIIAKETTLNKSVQVTFQKIANTCPPNDTNVEDLYQVGVYPFAKQSESQDADGVVITYTDIDGKEWSSDRGSAEQAGSRFEVVAHKSINHPKYKYETEAVFNCVLYNDAGAEMVLTNGRINSRSVRK